MIELPPDIRFALRANDIARRAAARAGKPAPDPMPVVKLFNPLGPATWLAIELGGDADMLFGLADLGFGCPELGYFSLFEIAGVRLPFGLGVERDLAFAPLFRLSVWTAWARRSGSILWAETLLRRAAQSGDGAELPTISDDGDGG